MPADDLELQRALALRAVTGGLLRLRWLAAATRFELAMYRHMLALKYNPDQPRVPRGDPDGGQWTDGGRAGAQGTSPAGTGGEELTDRRVVSDAAPDPVRSGAQYAQNRSRGVDAGPVVINGDEVEPTPGQAARLAVVEAQARDTLSRVHELDPNWKPTSSAYSTVEGFIAAYQADTQQAHDRLMQLRNVGIGPGPFAGVSIPAAGSVAAADPREINRIGSKSGCNTCGTFDPGTMSGNFVADHQPPTALSAPGNAQRLYPQCLACSVRQGGWVRQLRRQQ